RWGGESARHADGIRAMRWRDPRDALAGSARRAGRDLPADLRLHRKSGSMSLVVIENSELAFGGRTIFTDLNLRIGEEDRIGLVGRNGSGKSSLLRVLVGQQEPDRGSIRRAGTIRIGYLPQELD